MPVIKNKKTGIEYNVTNEDLSNIAKNPHLSGTFILPDIIAPPEVIAIKTKQKQRNKTKK